jgi:hypothetical protein
VDAEEKAAQNALAHLNSGFAAIEDTPHLGRKHSERVEGFLVHEFFVVQRVIQKPEHVIDLYSTHDVFSPKLRFLCGASPLGS